LRWDFYDSFGSTVNPRAGVIWKPRNGTTLKLLYGEAFRAPNVYQLYYSSIDQRSNPGLQPETIRTYELVADQHFAQAWHGSISLFRNESSGLIDTITDSSGFIIFTNASDASVNGAELEIEGKWDNGILTRASYTRQEAVDTKTDRQLVNSPKNVFKSQVSIPVWRDKIFASAEI